MLRKNGGGCAARRLQKRGDVRRQIRRIGMDRFLKTTYEERGHFEKAFDGFESGFCERKPVELVLLDESGEEQVSLTLIDL